MIRRTEPSAVVGRGSEIYGDFAHGRSAQGTGKLIFDAILLATTRGAGEEVEAEAAEARTTPAPKGCSFAPATPVLLANGKTKPIGHIRPGDKVEVADPKSGKHQGTHTVQHVWINHDNDLLDLTIRTKQGHTANFHTTANHPFWDDTTHTWVSAGKLHQGDALNTVTNGHAYVVTAQHTPGSARRWNLTVQQLHTYYVVAGGVPILVHNSCGPDNRTFPTRAEAKAAAYDRAGIAPGTEPDAVWTVGDDVMQRGMPGYRYDPNPGAHGIYEQFETENGSRLIAEHTNDPNAPFPHFHAGQPKLDPTREGLNFGWDMTTEFERYSPVDGSHHMYYESSG